MYTKLISFLRDYVNVPEMSHKCMFKNIVPKSCGIQDNIKTK